MIKLKVDMFNYTMFVITNKKELKKVKRHFKDKKTVDMLESDDYCGLHIGDGFIGYVVVLNNEISTLAHELLHAVQTICEVRGIEDQETSAYLMTYFMKNILDKKRNKIKEKK